MDFNFDYDNTKVDFHILLTSVIVQYIIRLNVMKFYCDIIVKINSRNWLKCSRGTNHFFASSKYFSIQFAFRSRNKGVFLFFIHKIID